MACLQSYTRCRDVAVQTVNADLYADESIMREIETRGVQSAEWTLKNIVMDSAEESIFTTRPAQTSPQFRSEHSTALSVPEMEQSQTRAGSFDVFVLPDSREMKKAANRFRKRRARTPASCGEKSDVKQQASCDEYRGRLTEFLRMVEDEKEPPTTEQLAILRAVTERLLDETAEGNGALPWKRQRIRVKCSRRKGQAMRALVHGLPGTGKSRVIQWVIRMFTECMGFTHDVEFICVAFQNKVAHAMNGSTLHSAANIPIAAGGNNWQLNHKDLKLLCKANTKMRWILIDEVFMIPDELLGAFAANFAAASSPSIFQKYDDGSTQVFGGYNVMMFGDTLQLPPIPSSTALFLPPGIVDKAPHIQDVLNVFWGNDANSLNYFTELTQQLRVEDPWYRLFLARCRAGHLDDEMYNFILGLPTQHCGSWMAADVAVETTRSPEKASHSGTLGYAACGNTTCASLHEVWYRMAKEGTTWTSQVSMECKACEEERRRRNRLLKPQDARLHEEPFVSAPYVTKNNDPKYKAMLLRAVQDAERTQKEARDILWVASEDKISNLTGAHKRLQQREHREEEFVHFHDQKTAGIPGLLPLFSGMKARLTENVARGRDSFGTKVNIPTHGSCTVHSWDISTDACEKTPESKKLLNCMPKVIYLKFENATWQVSASLPKGIWPLHPVYRTWELPRRGVMVHRKGFTLVPDYASTAFMKQGETLPAEIADCGDLFATPGITESLTAYVMLSRLRRVDALLLTRTFTPNLFRFGPSPGPACLLIFFCDAVLRIEVLRKTSFRRRTPQQNTFIKLPSGTLS